MGLKQLILLIAFFALSIVGVNVPDTLLVSSSPNALPMCFLYTFVLIPVSVQQFSDSGCLTYVDHNGLDVQNWACGAYLGGLVSTENDKYKITVYTGFQGGNNPPKTTKPQYMQTFEWSGYQGDVSAPENTCLHTC